MKKLAVLILTCAITAGSVFTGQANAAAPNQPNELTPQQMEQINNLFNTYYNNMSTVRQAIIAKGAQLNKLATSPDPDRNQIELLARAIGQLRGKLLAERAELQAKLQQMGVSPQVLHLAHSLPVPEYKTPSKFNNYYNWGGSHHRHHHQWDGNPYRGGYGPGYAGYYGPMGMMGGWYGPNGCYGAPWLY